MTAQLILPPQPLPSLSQSPATLPILDLDHPGANDPNYRKRRETITSQALAFHSTPSSSTAPFSSPSSFSSTTVLSCASSIPLIDYTTEEHRIWQHVYAKLTILHAKHASSFYQQGIKQLNISPNHIPQLRHLSQQLQQLNGFRLEPIHGLVEPRHFLTKLAHNIMLCTQYIRHSSKPEFTPEPDIIHEVLGHVPLFTNIELNQFSQLLGKAALNANQEQLTALTRLYWYTIEYGLINENGQIKAFGAGLLGGIQDLTNACSGKAIIKPFNISEIINTDFNYSFEQPHFFVIPSFAILQEETKKWLESL